MRKTRSSSSKALAYGCALLLCFSLLFTGGARGKVKTTTTRLAPGVDYTVIRDSSGPWRIRIVSIDLSKRSTLDVALANDRLPGFEKTSSMARRNDALVAINGDYARGSGRPVFTFAQDGLLMQTALAFGRNFAVDATESAAFIGHPRESVRAQEHDSLSTHTISAVNAGAPTGDEIAQFTPSGGSDELPPPRACSARLFPRSTPQVSPVDESVETLYEVNEAKCTSHRMSRKKGVVLSTPMTSTQSTTLTSFLPGEQLTLAWSLRWPGVLETIGGNPTLLQNGKIVEKNVRDTGSAFFNRHPRTGVGFTKDGKVLFVVVDGRQPRYSVGMTLEEFAELFQELGAARALNLDGGGSTTMVIDGEIVNRPSDPEGERPVSSALLLLPRAQDPAPAKGVSGSGAESRELWRRVVTDPASTGGLASALRMKGLPLPPPLEKAAVRFRGR